MENLKLRWMQVPGPPLPLPHSLVSRQWGGGWRGGLNMPGPPLLPPRSLVSQPRTWRGRCAYTHPPTRTTVWVTAWGPGGAHKGQSSQGQGGQPVLGLASQSPAFHTAWLPSAPPAGHGPAGASPLTGHTVPLLRGAGGLCWALGPPREAGRPYPRVQLRCCLGVRGVLQGMAGRSDMGSDVPCKSEGRGRWGGHQDPDSWTARGSRRRL